MFSGGLALECAVLFRVPVRFAIPKTVKTETVPAKLGDLLLPKCRIPIGLWRVRIRDGYGNEAALSFAGATNGASTAPTEVKS